VVSKSGFVGLDWRNVMKRIKTFCCEFVIMTAFFMAWITAIFFLTKYFWTWFFSLL